MANKRSRFQFVPTSGQLPGKQFATQTEAAINELSEKALDAEEKAYQAIDTADIALKTASEAIEKSQAAQSAANNAMDIANDASETAEKALLKAEQAEEKADNAFDKAANAESNALESSDTAEQANASANTALSAANDAKRTADTAYAKADIAQLSVDSILYYARTSDEPSDPFSEYASAKYFIENILEGIPGKMKEQGFLTIRSEKLNTDTTSYYVYQTYHTISGIEYTRTGTVMIIDSGDVVSWGDWVSNSDVPGNAATATKLKTSRKIGNAAFDGTKDITVSQIGAFAVNRVTLSADTDWNTLTTAGSYHVSQEVPFDMAYHQPPKLAHTYGVLMVFNDATTGYAQTFYASDGNTWCRNGSSMGWQSWKVIGRNEIPIFCGGWNQCYLLCKLPKNSMAFVHYEMLGAQHHDKYAVLEFCVKGDGIGWCEYRGISTNWQVYARAYETENSIDVYVFSPNYCDIWKACLKNSGALPEIFNVAAGDISYTPTGTLKFDTGTGFGASGKTLFNAKEITFADLSNLSAAGKSVISGLGMPSDTFETIAVTFTEAGTAYTAPANGWVWFYMSALSNSNNDFGVVIESKTNKRRAVSAAVGKSSPEAFLPVQKGEVLRLTPTFTGTLSNVALIAKFYYAKGEV